MATTNQNDRSLGDIVMSSGNGTPDHTDITNGSLYVDEDGVNLYHRNTTSGWTQYNRVSHGNMWMTGNSTNTSISVQGDWYSLRGLAWNGGSEENISYNATDYLDILVDGTYQVIGTSTFEEVAADGIFAVGLSINFDSPVQPNYMMTSVESSDTNRQCATVVSFIDLVSGDTLELGVSNQRDTNNVTVVHASISAKRISD
jgi:hypothetical protein